MATQCSGRIAYKLPFGWTAERPCRIPADGGGAAARMGLAEPPMCERHRAFLVLMLRNRMTIPKSKALRRWIKGAGRFDDLQGIMRNLNLEAS